MIERFSILFFSRYFSLRDNLKCLKTCFLRQVQATRISSPYAIKTIWTSCEKKKDKEKRQRKKTKENWPQFLLPRSDIHKWQATFRSREVKSTMPEAEGENINCAALSIPPDQANDDLQASSVQSYISETSDHRSS